MSDQQLSTILIGSDHAGYNLKEYLKIQLNCDYKIEDCGCNDGNISVDYPDYAKIVCQKIQTQSYQNNPQQFAILICGSGIGISISANRYKNIRAALCNNIKLAKLSRAHNNANILCLGARFVKNETALAIVNAFLKTKFEGGRHEARIAKLS